jgi:hypothetical protein
MYDSLKWSADLPGNDCKNNSHDYPQFSWNINKCLQVPGSWPSQEQVQFDFGQWFNPTQAELSVNLKQKPHDATD